MCGRQLRLGGRCPTFWGPSVRGRQKKKKRKPKKQTLVQNLQERGNPERLRALVPPQEDRLGVSKASGGVMGRTGAPAPAPSRPALETRSCPATSLQGIK
ncbi:hypothetical protein VULLAG_LOCUS16758 [Vulpes lagopus]